MGEVAFWVVIGCLCRMHVRIVGVHAVVERPIVKAAIGRVIIVVVLLMSAVWIDGLHAFIWMLLRWRMVRHRMWGVLALVSVVLVLRVRRVILWAVIRLTIPRRRPIRRWSIHALRRIRGRRVTMAHPACIIDGSLPPFDDGAKMFLVLPPQ